MKLRIVFQGVLLVVLLSLVVWFSFDLEFESVRATSIYALVVLISAFLVGWQLQKPSWREALAFAIACLMLSPKYVKATITHFSIGASISLVSAVLLAMSGVLIGGLLSKKKRKGRAS